MVMINNIRQVYQILADEQSKEIYLALLNHWIAGDSGHLDILMEKYMPQILIPYDTLISDLIRSLPKDKKLLLYGAGKDGEKNLHYFESDERFIGFCDGNPEKQKSGLKGHPVISPEQLLQRDDVSVVISTSKAREEVREYLKRGSFPDSRIYEIPICRIISKRGEILGWNFMNSEHEESFADEIPGTSLEVMGRCCKLKKKYMFNPDQNSTDVEPFCIEEVEVLPIKVNTECTELELLKSAKHTILKNKPKLKVSLRFNPETIVNVVMCIKELIQEYKIYVRYCSDDPFGTVLYAVLT